MLAQEHHLGYCTKLGNSIQEVYIPRRCSKYMYTMTKSDMRRGAILHLLFSFVIAIVDTVVMIAPCMPFDTNSPQKFQYFFPIERKGRNKKKGGYLKKKNTYMHTQQQQQKKARDDPIDIDRDQHIVACGVVSLVRASVPPSQFDDDDVPTFNHSGESKEYDGYRYYRSWMWSSLLNVPFTGAALALVFTGSPGLDAVSIVVAVLNLLNVGRCFLAAWACFESGNNIHSDFEKTIHYYRL
ncbi:hypothetical protein RFI_27300 [Reticulomyxa filosa]|uniref:Uncharacterized protein n=1 Tax=Reticulomyxa filosa TaxID=46433 RepID=X6M7W9_RETFI|nr:hypothetical protein RFI_27300 [Reticulomyxa filosa]|eukprot:ETO10078.1 hypothetical protein RFI_27300 [Reticulomyxa filosa]